MESKAIYIALDTETGGIGDDKSLLTAYLGAFDSDFNLVAELDLKIKPNDDIYVLTAEALGINGIDIIGHAASAIYEKDAATQIYNFLNKINANGIIKLIPIGHNVAFDIRFLCQKTLSKKSWDKFVGYRCLDTGTIGMFLIQAGILPADLSASLGSLAKHFGIEFDAHTAKGDTLATVEVLKRMLRLVALNRLDERHRYDTKDYSL